MPVELRALYQQSRSLSADVAECDNFFWDAVRHYASEGDLLCYGLWVHGEQAPVLMSLAFSRHAHFIASTMENAKQSLVVCPPEHGKSALMRWEMELWIGMETQRAYHDIRHTVPSAALIMNTASQAEKQIMEIEETLEKSAKYKALFPEVKPDKRKGWTKDHFFLQRPRSRPDPTLQGTGMFGPIQGGRVGKITVDDPTDQQDARSDTLLRAQSEWMAGTLDDRVMRHGTKRYILTRWSAKDTFSTLSKDSKVATLVLPALPRAGIPDPLGRGPDESLWPEEWPFERLEEKRQGLIDKGLAYLWTLTYLCDPSVAQGDMFQRDWVIYGMPPKEEAA